MSTALKQRPDKMQLVGAILSVYNSDKSIG